jgi:hypothetical protein
LRRKLKIQNPKNSTRFGHEAGMALTLISYFDIFILNIMSKSFQKQYIIYIIYFQFLLDILFIVVKGKNFQVNINYL